MHPTRRTTHSPLLRARLGGGAVERLFRSTIAVSFGRATGCAGRTPDGLRLRGLFVVPWRAGLRISEALALAESDLDPARGAILVRRGKGGKPRQVGMDQWASVQMQPWLAFRQTVPVGLLSCVIYGPTCGRPWSAAARTGRRPARCCPRLARALQEAAARGRDGRGHDRDRPRRSVLLRRRMTTSGTCTRVTQGWAPAVRSQTSVACRMGVGVRAPPAA
jgi:integrase